MSMIDRYDIFILLMENKSGRLVVYSILYSFFLHPRWLARFQPSTNIFIGHFFFKELLGIVRLETSTCFS